MGVALGVDLYGPRYDNPKGFFEDKIANQLDDEVLKRCDCWWGALLLPSEIAPDVVNFYQSALKKDVFKRFNESTLWGLKDPRISRLWRLWLPVFKETGVMPVFVLANRHPFSVASSLAKRDRMPKAQALALWIVHQLDSLEALVEHGGLVVDYDLMMQAPRQELYRIAQFLGTADRLDQSEISRFESDFLDHELRHAHYLNESAATPLQKLCLDLYSGLLEMAHLPGGLVEAHIDHARNLIAQCRCELSKFADWMQAIDDLHSGRLDEIGPPSHFPTTLDAHSRVPGLSDELENIATLVIKRLAQRDQVIAEQSLRLGSMRDELLRAEAQLDLLKDVMWGSREEDRL